MQLRKLVLACGFVSFALSNYASALGLGEVKLNSKLNQPLNAEIKLLETRDLSAEQILVALASPADFERNGVDRLYFYTEFQFEVDLKHAGGPVVKVTTRNPVREPYLNFLIEARWTAGRLLREYTLLMDLPTFDSTPPHAVQPAETVKPKVSTAAPKPRSIPSPAVSEQAAAPSATASEPAAEAATEDRPKKKSKLSSGTYGPIDSSDTLWEIAKAVRPDSSVSVHQTMIALQRLNPDAFIRGNINLLKKGQVLRVPDAAEAIAINRSEAVSEVAAQNNKWSASGDTDTGLGAQLDASRTTTSIQHRTEPVSGRVKLEAPSGAGGSDSGHGSGSDKAGGKGLEAQLATNLEELDKAKSENTELTSRVHDLEEQIKTMQRLVDASNEKMRALQLTAAKQAENVATAKTETAPAPQETAPVASTTESAAASSAAAAVAPVTAAASSAKKKNAPVKPKPQEKTFVDLLSDNILWVALGAVGVLGAGVVYMRRRKEEDDSTDFTATPSFYAPEPRFEAPKEFSQNEQPETQLELEAQEEIEDENTSVVAETDDVVSEAGIYISLGKYHQAEEMLLNALENNTPSSGIYLKLLEVYSQTQNITEFDKQYAALWPIGSPFELHRASELRANIADAGAFQGAHQASETVINNEFNTELDETIEPVDENVDVTARRYDLDFGKAPIAAGPADVNVGEEFVLDFEQDNKVTHPDAEDLSDISLALDGLEERNDHIIEDDIEVATLEDDATETDEEISFDFNELDAENTKAKDSMADLTLHHEDHADDFNLEMDVDDVDLAALDREMEHLDNAPASLDSSEVADEISTDDADFDALFNDEPTPEETESAADAGTTEVVNNTFESAQPSNVDLGDELTLDLDEDVTLSENKSGAAFDTHEELAAASEELASETHTSFEPADDNQTIDLSRDAALNLTEDFTLEDTKAELDSALENVSVTPEEAPAETVALDVVDDGASLSDLDKELQHLGDLEPDPDEQLVQVLDDHVFNEKHDDIDEEVFNLALSDFSAESLNAQADDLSEEDVDAELDFMVDADEIATKLDLARAYLDMGDHEGARDILAEVAQEGNEQQREEAVSLLSRIDA